MLFLLGENCQGFHLYSYIWAGLGSLRLQCILMRNEFQGFKLLVVTMLMKALASGSPVVVEKQASYLARYLFPDTRRSITSSWAEGIFVGT